MNCLLRCALSILIPAAAALAADVPTAPVTVDMKDSAGKSVGTATVSPADNGVKIDLDLHGLPPGVHGFHIHAVGKCDGPDFTTAGGHFNPDKKQHGSENPNGPHAGDLDNLAVDADGNVKTTVIAEGAKFAGSSDPHSIFHPGGTALVIHAGEDDMKTDPSGNSGKRIACGVISQ